MLSLCYRVCRTRYCDAWVLLTHALSPQPIPYECIYDYVTKTTARHPDTIFSHTLPSRFASRLWRLAHPSHALASPPSAAYEARATGIGV